MTVTELKINKAVLIFSFCFFLLCPLIVSGADFHDLQVRARDIKNIEEKLKYTEQDIIKRSIGNTYCLLCLPENYDPDKSYPVLLGFHGYGSIPEQIVLWWAETAAKNGFILAALKSTEKGWDKEDKLNVFKLIAKLEKNYSVKKNDIFIFGYSSGANFGLYLGLNYPHQFKGIAAVGGSLFKARRYIGKTELSDKPHNRIPVLLFVGKKDRVKNLEYARRSKKLFKKFEYDFTYKEFSKSGHVYKNDYTSLIRDWLLVLASPSADL